MKEKLIDKEHIKKSKPIFQGFFGGLLIDLAFKLSGANKVNAIYDASKHLTGLDFVHDMVKKLNIKLNLENIEVLNQYKEGPFITVSNHPYGHIDGILAIDVVGSRRSDYKMMVNWMLMNIDTMEDHFIGVNPYAKGTKMASLASSLSGVKQCLEHIRAGHPLGLFPAGGVSDPYLDRTEDSDWKETVIKLVRKAKVPIIPMFFAGNNSWFYRFLGFIDWRIRVIRLLHEVDNKRGKTITIRFGKPIYPEDYKHITDIKELAAFLKAKTYELKKHPNR